MAGMILTPTAIWKDFKVPAGVGSKIVGEEIVNGATVKHLYIEGRETSDGRVNIYGALVSGKNALNAPTVLLVQDFKDGTDLSLAFALVSRGYDAFVIDLAGRTEGKERFTEYPESVSYANLSQSVYGECEIEGEVTDTCWYEWCAAILYAAAYLKERAKNPHVGAIGILGAATALWQAAAITDCLDCVAFVGNAGWYGYRGLGKFGTVAEPQFSDGALKFIAGVEPQSYAKQIKCPALMLSPTNSAEFDCDRAYDTVSRIDENIYTAIEYSVGSRDEAGKDCFTDLEIFLEQFLNPSKSRAPLAGETFVKGDFKDGALYAEVTPFADNLKEIFLYVAEESVEPCFRCWRKISRCEEGENGTFLFKYSPYKASGLLTYFAEAVYKNGFRVCSLIAAKTFTEKDAVKNNKHRIIYSSRIEGAESTFAEAYENGESPRGLNISGKPQTEVKKGPEDLYGLYGKNGLVTFNISAEKYRPAADALLMLDIYVKGGADFTVRLIADYFGEGKTEYTASVKALGGEAWQNVKFEKNNFKTVDGIPLKSYDKIEAIEFYTENEFLINNVLWV